MNTVIAATYLLNTLRSKHAQLLQENGAIVVYGGEKGPELRLSQKQVNELEKRKIQAKAKGKTGTEYRKEKALFATKHLPKLVAFEYRMVEAITNASTAAGFKGVRTLNEIRNEYLNNRDSIGKIATELNLPVTVSLRYVNAMRAGQWYEPRYTIDTHVLVAIQESVGRIEICMRQHEVILATHWAKALRGMFDNIIYNMIIVQLNAPASPRLPHADIFSFSKKITEIIQSEERFGPERERNLARKKLRVLEVYKMTEYPETFASGLLSWVFAVPKQYVVDDKSFSEELNDCSNWGYWG